MIVTQRARSAITLLARYRKFSVKFLDPTATISNASIRPLCFLVISYRSLHHKNITLPRGKDGPFPSRFHPGSKIENAEEKIREMLTNQNPLNSDDWDEIKSEVLINYDFITELTFSTVIMSCLTELNAIKLAHSFMEYMNDSRMKSNFLTHLKYMSLCGKNRNVCGEDIIVKTFQSVKPSIDRTPVLDHRRAEYLIHGLCATHLWRLSFEYLKKLVPENPSIDMKNHLAAAAMRQSDESLAWEILTKWIRSNEYPSNFVFKACVLHAQRLQKDQPERSLDVITKMFQYLSAKHYILSEEVVELVGNYFKCLSNEWNISYAKVSRNGTCESCKLQLQLEDLKETEFQTLRNAFLERSVKKGDLFINSTITEFNYYIRFVDTHKPFDLVIDGLNTAYTTVEIKTKKHLAVQLCKVVTHLSKQYPRILVLGRHHMKSWPLSILKQISEKARLFLTSNISQDDPFIIYAALASGPRARILSDDLMRDHIARLDEPRLIQLCKKWQQSHQMFLNCYDNNRLKFTEPLTHSIALQGDMQIGWHIPYDDKIVLEPYEELNNWLCIRRRQK